MIDKTGTVAEYIAHFVVNQSCAAVFQVSGGMIAFLTDAIDREEGSMLFHNRHEQGSGFAAEGATRVSGVPAVAMATSGPGATNLITPIASSFFDSTPSIFITGQVRTDELKKMPDQRQNGFQELDICTAAHSITKKTWRVSNSNEIESIMNEAWELCQSGRPGPVLIDIPIDIQQEVISWASDCTKPLKNEFSELSHQAKEKLNKALNLLNKAENPIVIIGGGVRIAKAVDFATAFLEKTNIPFVATLMGLDSIDHSNPNYLGFIGSYGNRWANYALCKSDVVLVLGSRLDVRQTGPDVANFARGKTIIRVDVDTFELDGRVPSQIKIEANLLQALEYLTEFTSTKGANPLVVEVKSLKQSNPQIDEQEISLNLNPNYVLEKISTIYRKTNGYVVDVGQHQMWAAQSIKLEKHQRLLTSGGLGSMGFAIPASIGASAAREGRWIVIVGDGCLQLSLQELQTISHYRLPISIIVMNNGQHGMVAQFQEENMNSRFIGTREGYSNPDLELISKAFGFERFVRIKNDADFLEFADTATNFTEGPELIEFVIDNRAKALPKMKYKS